MRIKLKRTFIITVLLIGFIIDFTSGQTFKIRSFSGDETLLQVSTDDEKDILKVICSEDTIYIRNVTALKSTKLLNNNFLMIVYSLRAGTGMNLMNTLIISANNNVICQSLNINSSFKDEFLDFSKPVKPPIKVEVKSIYSVKLSLFGVDNLNAKVHNERESIHEPKSNYNRNSTINLNFDKTQKIFYSSREQVSQNFTIFDPKTQERSIQHISGTFPILKLDDYKYYYIKGEWYERGADSDDFSKLSYK